MGTRKSRHNKGRKPLYKEHRDLAGNNPAEIVDREFVEPQGPDAFLFSSAMKALTVEGVQMLSEESARELFATIRWSQSGGKPYCPSCGCCDLYEGFTRPLWTCTSCKKQFSVTSGTIFSSKKAGFKTLLMAAIAMTNNRERRNQSEAAREAGFRQESAHALSEKLRRLSLTTAINHVNLTGHEFRLDRPRYAGGAWLSSRTWWTDPEKAALKSFADTNAPLDKVADALGRDPKSIAWFARDLVGNSIMPSEWKALIKPKRKPRILAAPEVRLAYPYIRKSRPSDAELLRVNDLVPRVLAEWIRADVCQSIMLALYEGSIEMADLEANKSKVAWFIKKFYREQMPHEEISLEGRYDEDKRDSYDVAASLSGVDWEEDQLRERRGTYSGMSQTFTPPSQIDDLYGREVSAAHWASIERGEDYSREEIRLLLDAGEIASDLGVYMAAPILSHSADRSIERHGIEISRNMAAKIKRYCQTTQPTQRADGDAYYLVPISGKLIPVIYDRHKDIVKTVLPEGAAFVRGHQIRTAACAPTHPLIAPDTP